MKIIKMYTILWQSVCIVCFQRWISCFSMFIVLPPKISNLNLYIKLLQFNPFFPAMQSQERLQFNKTNSRSWHLQIPALLLKGRQKEGNKKKKATGFGLHIFFLKENSSLWKIIPKSWKFTAVQHLLEGILHVIQSGDGSTQKPDYHTAILE